MALQQTFRPRLGVALVFCSAIAVFVVGGRVIQLTATGTRPAEVIVDCTLGLLWFWFAIPLESIRKLRAARTTKGGSTLSLDCIDVVLEGLSS